jgi:hypothetical protein
MERKNPEMEGNTKISLERVWEAYSEQSSGIRCFLLMNLQPFFHPANDFFRHSKRRLIFLAAD